MTTTKQPIAAGLGIQEFTERLKHWAELCGNWQFAESLPGYAEIVTSSDYEEKVKRKRELNYG